MRYMRPTYLPFLPFGRLNFRAVSGVLQDRLTPPTGSYVGHHRCLLKIRACFTIRSRTRTSNACTFSQRALFSPAVYRTRKRNSSPNGVRAMADDLGRNPLLPSDPLLSSPRNTEDPIGEGGAISFVDCRGSFDGLTAGGANDSVFVDSHTAHKVRTRRACRMLYVTLAALGLAATKHRHRPVIEPAESRFSTPLLYDFAAYSKIGSEPGLFLVGEFIQRLKGEYTLVIQRLQYCQQQDDTANPTRPRSG